jgi:hypothetical protein
MEKQMWTVQGGCHPASSWQGEQMATTEYESLARKKAGKALHNDRTRCYVVPEIPGGSHASQQSLSSAIAAEMHGGLYNVCVCVGGGGGGVGGGGG